MNVHAHNRIARIHLPVAPDCNIRCGYCVKRVSVTDTSVNQPGISTVLFSPEEALSETQNFLNEWGCDSVVGIAGPGDPLANSQTFETLHLLNKHIPNVRLCLCTNGLKLPESVDLLKTRGVSYLSVTVNSLNKDLVKKIHPVININEEPLTGDRGAQVLIDNQLEGISRAASEGIFVKVNTVVIPGINDDCVEAVARRVSETGAGIMNLMPLIPAGKFRQVKPPSEELMVSLFRKCEAHIPVFTHCRQCRADARGIPGKEGCSWKKTA